MSERKKLPEKTRLCYECEKDITHAEVWYMSPHHTFCSRDCYEKGKDKR